MSTESAHGQWTLEHQRLSTHSIQKLAGQSISRIQNKTAHWPREDHIICLNNQAEPCEFLAEMYSSFFLPLPVTPDLHHSALQCTRALASAARACQSNGLHKLSARDDALMSHRLAQISCSLSSGHVSIALSHDRLVVRKPPNARFLNGGDGSAGMPCSTLAVAARPRLVQGKRFEGTCHNVLCTDCLMLPESCLLMLAKSRWAQMTFSHLDSL